MHIFFSWAPGSKERFCNKSNQKWCEKLFSKNITNPFQSRIWPTQNWVVKSYLFFQNSPKSLFATNAIENGLKNFDFDDWLHYPCFQLGFKGFILWPPTIFDKCQNSNHRDSPLGFKMRHFEGKYVQGGGSQPRIEHSIASLARFFVLKFPKIF